MTTVQAVPSFPSVRLASFSGGLPVDVALIAQLGIGAGDKLIKGVLPRQRAHEAYVDALDEPSARIAGVDLARGDATSLYTFSVGTGGHPFHRHAGHRVFTAVSGSGGACLRFSTASTSQTDADPQSFVDALREVAIPPDCLFTVRFGGGTWHQFVPLQPRSRNPALFALSCHTNELGGDLPATQRRQVEANAADIPSLTEVLPEPLLRALQSAAPGRIPRVELSLIAVAMSPAGRMCAAIRRRIGPLRGMLDRLRPSAGFMTDRPGHRHVDEQPAPPASSLLHSLLPQHTHQDSFVATLSASEVGGRDAQALLADVLEGFLRNRPQGVSGLMALRNLLVKPLRLRTSPLGCPVSSLLGPCTAGVFAGTYPVLAQRHDGGRSAQVILGADDRHLRFRSCVSVEIGDGGRATIALGTRVQTLNAFGRCYMGAIERVHRRYISPAMLRSALDHATCPHPMCGAGRTAAA